MAYRLACERAEQVTAVAVLAGADQLDERACTPSEPVSVLHLHGTDDQVVAYDGGAFVAIFAEDQINRSRPSRAYPGAVDTVARWASRNGCDAAPGDGTALDLDTGLDGAETTATAHGGCAEGVDVQLDTIAGGGHIPSLDQETFGTEVLDWLLAHAR
jgi:polyhydroxybutyrate depolymerase